MRKALLLLFITIVLVRVWIWFSENDPLGTAAHDSLAVAAEEVQVTIGAERIEPRTVSVRATGEVEWINEDGEARTLQAGNGQLRNPELPPGGAFDWEAAEPGVIHYTLDAEGHKGHVVILGQDEQLFDGRTDAATFEKIAEVEGVETPTGIFNSHRRTETLGH